MICHVSIFFFPTFFMLIYDIKYSNNFKCYLFILNIYFDENNIYLFIFLKKYTKMYTLVYFKS